MNVFNRIVIILDILILMTLVVVIMLSPVYVVDLATFNLELFREAVFDYRFYYVIGGGGVLLLILLILLWLEVRRPRHKMVRIRAKGRGNAQLGVESVMQSLEYRIDELPGVRKVEPSVVSRGRDARVILNLDTSPSVNIPMLTEQVVEMAHDILGGQLGLKVRGKVRVNIKHEPYPRGAMPSLGVADRPSVSTERPAPVSRPLAEPEPMPLQPSEQIEVRHVPISIEDETSGAQAEESKSEGEDVSSDW